MTTPVCSTNTLYHYLFRPDSEAVHLILQKGLLPISDLPDEPHAAIKLELYKNIYQMMAEPILKRPYSNSGIFVTPIDFRRVPDSYLTDKPRFAIPINRIEAESAVLTYELEGQRAVFPFSQAALVAVAERWTVDLVQRWFGVDQTRMFYYVPQVATYQAGGIRVEMTDYDDPNA